MLDPKTPLAAAAIFGAGILVGQNNLLLCYLYHYFEICCIRISVLQVVGYSILDVNRSLQQNDIPVTEQQNRDIHQQVQDSEHKVAGVRMQILSPHCALCLKLSCRPCTPAVGALDYIGGPRQR